MQKVRNFRNLVQGYLFRRAVNEFMGHYEEIMSGSYEKSELLACEDDFITYLKKEVTEKTVSAAMRYYLWNWLVTGWSISCWMFL